MRKSNPGPSVVGLMVLIPTVAFVVWAAEIPESVTIDECQAKQSAVVFPHKQHVDHGMACVTCHHTQADLKADSGVAVEKCGSCHLEPAEATTPKCSEMSTTKNPYHIGCIDCHKQEAQKNEATKAPTKCFDCHPKA
ncbi:MAG TPA: cytochrome c3 family protein [Candidatus Polarisedimenticolaceae bacterium]|nr:cytochrome c3 family protein [Candidatus Polarisedimenticolaceae bacterium]